jgi:hypothetical protein
MHDNIIDMDMAVEMVGTTTEAATTAIVVVQNRAYQLFVAWVSSSEELREQLATLYERLDVPEWNVYSIALRDSWNDIYRATISTTHLLYLTFRPLCILLYILLQNVWKFVLEHGGKSLQKGFVQLKYASIRFWEFQRSLTYQQVLGEIALVATFVGMYFLYRWLKRQSYYSRVIKYIRVKRDHVVQVSFQAMRWERRLVPTSIRVGGIESFSDVFTGSTSRQKIFYLP